MYIRKNLTSQPKSNGYQGTLAKSGTTEFLQKAESGSTDGTGTGNLIGSFGLGFYSSFLVADRVYVASLPPKTTKNPDPVQHVFSSSAEESSFQVYPDPRGNTLGSHGTEITLVLKEDAKDYLDAHALQELVYATFYGVVNLRMKLMYFTAISTLRFPHPSPSTCSLN